MSQIKATVIQASKHISNDEYPVIITFELEYPRFIHSELMTHRVFSRNAASSRAIPTDKLIEQVRNNPAMPVYWGINRSGMQAVHEHSDINACRSYWKAAAASAAAEALRLSKLDLHKQIINRVLEPFMLMKTIVTSTEWENFYDLRLHKDAQPEFKVLAETMYKSIEDFTPMAIDFGEWHVPYIKRARNTASKELYYVIGNKVIDLPTAIKISGSCCAQVSYKATDTSIEKAERIYDKLITSKPAHASPIEHQCTPSNHPTEFTRNFKGWVQHRAIIEENY